ncbi:MAG: Asp-tRNA(Asn)/Glu-tRNA(Gln) amidotransferase subunit GatB [Myxococcales bacterium]|nr:Asp-tRNA(Asn)/Glu-tRNA(Gln) amidotransferase subunit GatB [Myxococcales bacterium]
MRERYEAVIGLEVHAQLLTRSKIFCGCSTRFGAPPNANTCPVCLALPGTLPVLNREVVSAAVRLGLAVGSTISRQSRFARKNYFYPDLPKGYQISQYEQPICLGGAVPVHLDGVARSFALTRIHMEEDAGKLIHQAGRGESLVDFNRTGVPLLEIVSEPDLRSSAEAGAYLKSLRGIVQYLGICDGNMEEGSFRCDANVSVRPVGATELGTKAELKNLNSFRNVQRAIDFEIERQIDVLLHGGAVVQETRLFDATTGATRSMRSKEEAHDYRYFPDPDLLPVTIDEAWIESLRESQPELPEARYRRFVEAYGLSAYDADVLTDSRELGDYFEACVSIHENPKRVANWVQTELLGYLNEGNRSIAESPISAANLAEMLNLLESGVISGKMAKTVFSEMAATGSAAKPIVDRIGTQLTDGDALSPIVCAVLDANPGQVEEFLAGKEKVIGFFVGQIMRQTKGRANPQLVNELLRVELARRKETT